MNLGVCREPPRRRAWWLVPAAALLACLYLPSVFTRFDFNDDGVLAYPTPAVGWAELPGRIWERTLADFHSRGPFRPVVWAYHETIADVFGADAVAQRTVRLVWAAMAAFTLLWLLHELGFPPIVCILTGMLSMANPYRNEIWCGLGLTEAIGMPFALFSCVAAVRAARSPRPTGWDIAGALALLLALACKNTFAAVLPAVLFLRLCGSGASLRQGWKIHGRRACCLALVAVLPVAHFICYKLDPTPKEYQTHTTLAQVGRMGRSVIGAMSLDFIGLGIGLGLFALIWQRRRAGLAGGREPDASGSDVAPAPAERLAGWTGLILLVTGIGVYLPLNAVAGRYTIPAVWGADVWFAILLHRLARLAPGWEKRAAYVALGTGLAAVVVANVGKQEKFAARAELLWQAVDWLKQAPPGAQVEWVATSDSTQSQALQIGEGFHFRAHVHSQGRPDIFVELCDTPVGVAAFTVPAATGSPPTYALCDAQRAPSGPGWQQISTFRAPYWFGKKAFQCALWMHPSPTEDRP